MSILKEIAAKAAALRGDLRDVKSSKGTRTMTPVYDDNHVSALAKSIRQNAPEWLQLWFEISIETGGRTADIAGLRFSDLSASGELRYVVAKQSKAAMSRATRKGVELVREQRKAAAKSAGQWELYAQTDAATADELAETLTDAEEAMVLEQVSRAQVKIDSKQLSPGLCKRIAAYRARTIGADDDSALMFPAAATGSNRAAGVWHKPVTRQTIWRLIKPFMLAIEKAGGGLMRLSAYSTRKIAAFRWMKAGDKQQPGSGITLVMEMLGHSSLAMSKKYLGLDKLAARLQRGVALGTL
nr:MAG TPA: site specific tyrosine recombinase [Caudoviricetes sp.]